MVFLHYLNILIFSLSRYNPGQFGDCIFWPVSKVNSIYRTLSKLNAAAVAFENACGPPQQTCRLKR